MNSKLIYHFNQKKVDGDTSLIDLLGSKGSNLAEMCKIGMPVPPGFTITTELCDYYLNHENRFPEGFLENLTQELKYLETVTNKKFGSLTEPLLLAVRSGSKISMPGMMDTILNLGINDVIAYSLAEEKEKKYILNSYQRLIQTYGNLILGVPNQVFEDIVSKYSCKSNDLTEQDIAKLIIKEFQSSIKEITGQEFPQDVNIQLINAIKAVLNSWMSTRATIYRKLHGIDASLGTAVVVQSMVFGNYDARSATGVVFSRNPATGDNEVYGEYLLNAQGEDIVSGTQTPLPLTKDGKDAQYSMENNMPSLFRELVGIVKKLETYYKDLQDIEFTIEKEKLYILQTRSAKRTPQAGIKVAVDMTLENIISKEEAILRVSPNSLDNLLHTTIDYSKNPKVIARGLPASPGSVTGIVVLTTSMAEELAPYHQVILVRTDTSPEDIKGMHVASGILTVRGGMTSHAAVVTRGIGKPCVCGAGDLRIDLNSGTISCNNITINAGDIITIDGSSGNIILGQAELIPPSLSPEFKILMQWAKDFKRLGVRANSEVPSDLKNALSFGAEGVGLCRTEHMFFEPEKISLVRQMILTSDFDKRIIVINKLKELQTQDFKDLFKIAKDLPINIRLLDPPLHEFLPVYEHDIKELAEIIQLDISQIKARIDGLKEFNPMLGHRGCRLGITYPEIYEMQVESIFTAAIYAYKEQSIKVNLEINIPLVSTVKEVTYIKSLISKIYQKIYKKFNIEVNYIIGAMIEIPRAALCADKIALEVDFFSFGTNDLTQTTYGISRDDTASFLHSYQELKILDSDPFSVIDREGVGKIIETAIKLGTRMNSNLKIGICGEHGGNPESIEFFEEAEFDYVSCSPYRVPVAILAAAQASIKKHRNKKLERT